MKKNPIQFFDDWAKENKDSGMVKNHFQPVSEILKSYLPSKKKFSFIDAGCGNGWLVEYVNQMNNCTFCSGVDGSNSMIKKARLHYPENIYFKSNIESWIPEKTVDFVFSMEVIYYLNNPKKFIKHIRDQWLNKNGVFICALDYYFDNKSSHDWSKKYQIKNMTLLNKKEWFEIFSIFFQNIEISQINMKENWQGTLVFKCKN
ncbi:MAG: nodulation protein S NodS [Candidatus Marinimicrobia bacterium]|nr:nodulation protein S NodS [Candidatus Neomarinimicrobiota bacterium]OUW50321.1 MAG: hypothetical protein CBD50_03480 [bacterium TMED190]|tara:strand:+ start:378 stop:986 length:609 start_codon:yes stop_codon:yes gene_type:complete